MAMLNNQRVAKDRRWDIFYPLVMTNSLRLNMAIEIVDLPIDSMVDLSIVM